MTMDFLHREAAAGRRADSDKYLVAAPDVVPQEKDRLDRGLVCPKERKLPGLDSNQDKENQNLSVPRPYSVLKLRLAQIRHAPATAP